MAEITINKRRVDAAVKVATYAVAQEVRELHPVEALIAFSQIVGRVIAAQESTQILHNDMVKLATQQILTTLGSSYLAKGNNIGELNG